MKVPPSPRYDSEAVRLLFDRTEYEAWLLDAVYAITELNLVPSYPDDVIYPLGSTRAIFHGYVRANLIIGDWRPGFLNAGAPLVFISTFKLLDMLVEWVLERNESRPTYQFQDKIIKLNGQVLFPPLIEARPWLKQRLIGLYSTLEPLRGTIIHDKHFTSHDGEIFVSSSKRKIIGPEIKISSAELRTLTLTIVSVLRYVEKEWPLDLYREKILRQNLDNIASLHGLPLLGQREPIFPTVRFFSTETDPLRIDVDAIRSDLAEHYLDKDLMFNLRVLSVKEGAVVTSFFFPWSLLKYDRPGWCEGINVETYRVANPNDIDNAHCMNSITVGATTINLKSSS